MLCSRCMMISKAEQGNGAASRLLKVPITERMHSVKPGPMALEAERTDSPHVSRIPPYPALL